MNLRRIILLALLLPAAAASAWYFLLPGPGHELLVYVFVVPVVVLNMWEWTAPELLDSVLGKKQAPADAGMGIKDQRMAAGDTALPPVIPEVAPELQVPKANQTNEADMQKKSTNISTSAVQNRALSIRQPHAENILRGDKTVEYRKLPTTIRGRVYIYASKLPAEDCFWTEMGAKPGDFPTGLLVGTVEIVGCEKPDPSGEYQWRLANPIRLAELLKPENKPQPAWFSPFRKDSEGK